MKLDSDSYVAIVYSIAQAYRQARAARAQGAAWRLHVAALRAVWRNSDARHRVTFVACVHSVFPGRLRPFPPVKARPTSPAID